MLEPYLIMNTGTNNKERSPQDSQRPGATGGHKRSSVFGSSSNIFGHKPLAASQPSKTTNEIKNNAPSIQSREKPSSEDAKEKSDSKEAEHIITDSSNNKDSKEPNESTNTTTEPIKSEDQHVKGGSEIEDDPESGKSKPSTSFASYLSNVKKRKQEIEEKKNKELEETKANPATSSNEDVTMTEDSVADVNIEENQQPEAKSQGSTETTSTEVKREDPTIQETPQDKTSDASKSPVSTLSSELSILPSSSSADKQDASRSFHIPPRIPESDSNSDEGDITRTPRRKQNTPGGELSVAEDSDAETVHGDSPPKPRRGRLVRKSEMGSDVSDKKMASEGNHQDLDSSSYHKKLILGKLERRSQSKSVSPQRHSSTAKRSKGKDQSGRAKLQRACDKGKLEEAKRLLEEGAEVNDQDNAGNSALHDAALNGHTKIVELLLQHNAHINLRSGPEVLDTPLIDAAANGHISTVKMLLKYGADPRIQNSHGQNALDSLEDSHPNTPELKVILREATLAMKSKQIDVSGTTSDLGDSSYDEDRSNSHSRNQPRSRKRGARNDLLLVDFTTKEGREAVFSKASDGDVQFVGTYLENGGPPDSEALALAAKFGHTEVVNLFLAFGAKIDVTDEKGLTPLMQTVGRGHIDTVKLLLQAGADPAKLSRDNKSVLEIAKDSLISDEEEIRLLTDALNKVSNKSNSGAKSTNDTKVKKRKISVKDEQQDTHELKKKKHHSNQKQQQERSSAPATETMKEREHKGEKSRSHEVIKPKPVESKFSGPKSESMKTTHSSDAKHHVKVQKIDQPVESEEEKQARLIKEKEELRKVEEANELRAAKEKEDAKKREEKEKEEAQKRKVKEIEDAKKRLEREKEESKKREEFEAIRAAKRKAREQQFLNDFETAEKKKEEELKKLAELQAERKLKEAQENEARAKMEEEKKIIMSQKEEIERRRSIRSQYPYGLQKATFDGSRTKEEVLAYLPLYHFEKDGVQYCADLQVIMILGIERFYDKYQELSNNKKSIEEKEKTPLFNYFYPFLGNFSFRSTSKQMENFNEELQKFTKLNINWINYEDVLKIIKQDFEPIYDVVITRTLEIDLNHGQAAVTSNSTGFVIPKVESEPVSRKVSSSYPSITKRLPLLLRNRPAVLKALSKNKKLW